MFICLHIVNGCSQAVLGKVAFWQTPYVPQILKYLLFGSLQKKINDLYIKEPSSKLVHLHYQQNTESYWQLHTETLYS